MTPEEEARQRRRRKILERAAREAQGQAILSTTGPAPASFASKSEPPTQQPSNNVVTTTIQVNLPSTETQQVSKNSDTAITAQPQNTMDQPSLYQKHLLMKQHEELQKSMTFISRLAGIGLALVCEPSWLLLILLSLTCLFTFIVKSRGIKRQLQIAGSLSETTAVTNLLGGQNSQYMRLLEVVESLASKLIYGRILLSVVASYLLISTLKQQVLMGRVSEQHPNTLHQGL